MAGCIGYDGKCCPYVNYRPLFLCHGCKGYDKDIRDEKGDVDVEKCVQKSKSVIKEIKENLSG